MTLHSDIPRGMTRKAKRHENTLPADKFMKLQRLALRATLERDDEKFTQLCRKYRELLDLYFN